MSARAARFGAALAMLWAAHDLADHVVQTDHQAAQKAEDWSAMAGHVGSYTAVQVGSLAALSVLTGERATRGRTIMGVLFSAVSHAFLDRRWPVRWALEHSGSQAFADARLPRIPLGRTEAMWHTKPHPLPIHGPYLADQALHHACLAVSAAILAGGRR